MVILGQRTVLLVMMPLTLITWIALATANNATVLIITRFVLGLSIGIAGSSSTLLVVEVAHNKYRGPLVAFVDFARNSGILVMYCVGYSQLLWRYQALIVGLSTTIPAILLLIFLKESPRYLIIKNKNTEATKSLRFYRGSKYDISYELEQMREAACSSKSKKIGLLDQAKFLCKPQLIKLTFLSSIVVIGSHLSGNFALMSYAVEIFIETSPSFDPYLGAVLLGALRSIGGLILVITSSKIGRRVTFLVSMIICSISMAVLGSFIYFGSHESLMPYRWVPITFLMVFFCSVTIAVPVGTIFVHELIPLRCRLLGCGIIDMIFFLGGFVVASTFSFMRRSIQTYGTFWLYSVCSFIFAFVPILFLPETRGRSLEDIEKVLKIRK